MIKSTSNKGFQMTFENGITISVQFGGGNYCENKHFEYDYPKNHPVVECENAEIAIWDKNGEWYDFGTDTVKGWVPANEIAKWIYLASTINNLNEISELLYVNLPSLILNLK